LTKKTNAKKNEKTAASPDARPDAEGATDMPKHFGKHNAARHIAPPPAAQPKAMQPSASATAPEAPQSKQPQSSVWKDLGSLAVKIAVIALVFVLVFTFLYGFQRNTDPDMSPMVKDGDLVLYYRLDKTYTVGDLLLLDFKGKREIRRVVAAAGDIVDITDSGLVVNGSVQQEPDIYEKTQRYAAGVAFPLTVGKNQVFVLGDARENATDSRIYGPVNIRDTLGKVITVIRRRSF